GESHLGQVVLEVPERLHIAVEGCDLAVRDKYDPVDTLEHELARRVVKDLTGNGVKLQPNLHPADDAHIERQEVEKEGSVGLGLETDHLPARFAGGFVMDVLKIG